MKTVLLPTVAGLLRSRVLLHLEVLAPQQQLATLAARRYRRPHIRHRERLFRIWLHRNRPGCVDPLALVEPDTLVRWLRQGFRRYWTRRSRRRCGGRSAISPEIRALIRRLSRENPLGGAPRIHGGLQMLGIEISQTTVAKCLIRGHRPPSRTWGSFLDNQAKDLVSIGFLALPIAAFRMPVVLLVLTCERRKVVHTRHPLSASHP